MNMHQIAKYNQTNAEGTPMPAALPVMHYLVSLSKQVKYAEEMALILLMWITNEYDWLNDESTLPPFILISNEQEFSGELDSNKQHFKNKILLKIVELKPNWVEFTLQRKILKSEYVFWIPIPTAFNHLIWECIRHSARYKCPFTKKIISNVRNIFQRKNKPMPQLSQTKIATPLQWKSYINHCYKRDEVLHKSSRVVALGKHNNYNESIIHYIQGNTLALRSDLFNALNRYVDPVLSGVKAFELNQYLSYRSLRGLDTIKIRYSDEPDAYLKEQCIIERSKFTHEDRTITRLTKGEEKFGADFIPTSLTIANIFVLLADNTIKLQTQCSKKTTRVKLANYHNQLTLSFALTLVALTGIRPTHAIGPAFNQIGENNFTIKDKGIAREVPLTPFLQQQFQNYLQHIKQLSPIFPDLKNMGTFALLNDCDATPLTARELRHFTNEITTEIFKEETKKGNKITRYVHYLFRRSFANTLGDLACPSHLIDQLMGHYQFGEQAGYLIEKNQIQKIDFMRKIEQEFGAVSLFKEANK